MKYTWIFATNKYLLNDDDIDVLEAMQNEYTDTSGDRFITGYFRRIPYLEVDIVNVGDASYNTDIMTYTVETLRRIAIKTIDDYNNDPSGNPLVSDTDRNNILTIIGLFETQDIPPYTTYSANGFTLYSVPVGDVNPLRALDPVNGPPRFADVASSIWGQIYRSMISNYNIFYDKEVLKEEHFPTNLGDEMRYYRRITLENTGIIDYNDGSGNIDYYQTPSGNFLDPSGDLTSKIELYENFLNRYELNKLLFNMKNIIVPQSTYYYEKFEIIHNYIVNVITNDPDTYGYIDPSGTGPSGNIVREIIEQVKEDLDNVPTYGTMDWYDSSGVRDIFPPDGSGNIFNNINFQLAFEQYWNYFNGDISGNEYPEPTALSEFRDTYMKPANLGPIVEADERSKYNGSIGNFTASNLYERLTEIRNNYNDFKDEFSFYTFLMDEVIRASQFEPFLQTRETSVTNEEIWEDLQNTLDTLKTTSEEQLAKILGNPSAVNDAVDSILSASLVGNVVDPSDNSIIIGTIDANGVITNPDGSIFGQVSATGLIVNLDNIIVGSLSDNGEVLDLDDNVIGLVVLTGDTTSLSDVAREDLIAVLRR